MIIKFLFNKVFLFFILVNLFYSGSAQESLALTNADGKNFNQLKHTWRASWITHPSASTLDYGVFLFRRSFTLDEIPENFTIYVSADNRYRLFVNGHKIALGPARGTPLYWRYETLDIAQFLKKGKNIIAAEVVNFGEYRHGAQHSVQTAFILQSDSNLKEVLNTGDGQWKVTRNAAYQCLPFTSDSLGGYYAAGPCDEIIGDKYPWGWKLSNYDDSAWEKPKTAITEAAVGRHFLYGSTWFLVPRNIPMMYESQLRFDRIVRKSGMEKKSDFLSGKGNLVIPPHTKASILFDQGELTIGFPEWIMSGGKDGLVKITYAESLFDPVSEDVDLNPALRKGNRNETAGKEIFGYYDLIHPDGGRERFYKTQWYRTFRFVQLDVVTKDESLEIRDFYSNFWAYPFKEKGKFESDNIQLKKIWNTAWRTQRLNSTETYADCPYYEQLQYIGDTRVQALISYYVSGDDRLARNAIEQFDHSRLPEGLTLSRYPSYVYQVIPTYSLAWIGMLHDFYMYRNDKAYLEQFLPGVEAVLGWFERHLDSTNMLGNLEWWNFTDWTDGYINGVPPGAELGYSANVSLQYVKALQYAEELFYAFGKQKRAAHFSNIAKNVIDAVNEKCYDSVRKMYAETPEKRIFSQHTNIFAILTNSISVDGQKVLIKQILHEEDLIQASIYFKFYLFRALQQTGFGNQYLDMLTPWDNMLDQGLTTFAETENDSRSDCHAWSASPCFDLLHTVAGIQPDKAGYKSVLIAPNPGTLKTIKASLPHPEGDIIVDLHFTMDGNVKGIIELPKTLDGTFCWQNKKIKLEGGLQKIEEY